MTSDQRILCVIPARYGSTRLPGKPLIEIGGLPLVMWTYRAAERADAFDRIVVATDDERVQDTVVRLGGESTMTSPTHERGTDRVMEAAMGTDHPFVVNLQGDEPELSSDLLRQFAAALRARVDGNSMLTCVGEGSVDDMDNPNVVKVVLGRRDDALYFSRAAIPHSVKGGPAHLMKHTGIYGFTRTSLERFCSFPPGELERCEGLEQLRALENGMAIRCLHHSYESWGIDTPEDVARFRRRVEQGGT